jgi:hypothetical protein
MFPPVEIAVALIVQYQKSYKDTLPRRFWDEPFCAIMVVPLDLPTFRRVQSQHS